MTQSDDNAASDTRREPKYLREKFANVQRSVSIEATGIEVKRAAELDRTPEKKTVEPAEGSPGQNANTLEMGSTDSAGNTHSGGSSCGFVSSLFPNSCRGRAESFARRLHRRLTSLGGEGGNASEDEDESLNFGASRGTGSSLKVNESSWLHAPAGQTVTTGLSSATKAIKGPMTSTAGGYASSAAFQMEGRVLDSQPRHSPETDVYYDFDQEHCETARRTVVNDEYVTTSPAEIAAETEVANIIVNRNNKIADRLAGSEIGNGVAPLREPHSCTPEYLRDSESGCVYASPLPGTSPDTDNSEIFFDPESSETEKTCENDDSERLDDVRDVTANEAPLEIEKIPSLDDAILSKAPKRCPLRRRVNRVAGIGSDRVEGEDDDEEADDDELTASSSSSSSLRRRRPFGATSSEESLNGNKSSVETTTSPSHESLWSTFDESTLSFQDESSPGSVSIASVPIRREVGLPKSHSESEIVANDSSRSATNDGVDEIDRASDCSIQHIANGDAKNSTHRQNNHSTLSEAINELRESLCLESSLARRTIPTPEENLMNRENLLREEDTNGTSGDSSRLLERLATDTHVRRIEPPGSPPAERSDVEETEELEKNVDGEDQSRQEAEEEEEENAQPPRVRRCSSLKTGKTPPGTPGRKKIVRFADVLGLDLADVRTFLDEIPKIPNSAYSDLIYDDVFHKDSSPVNFWGTGPAAFTTPLYAATMPRNVLPNGLRVDRILVPLFQQPGGSLSFLDQVRERQVCLENVVVEDPLNMTLHGTVRVRNLDFHKSVHVRYTFDSWRNFSDLQATYASNSCDGFSDKFTFHLYCHVLKIGQRLELAVRFQCKGAQYWDNNGGVNYCFQCLPATSTNTGCIPITATPTIITTAASPPMSHSHNHEWSPAFY